MLKNRACKSNCTSRGNCEVIEHVQRKVQNKKIPEKKIKFPSQVNSYYKGQFMTKRRKHWVEGEADFYSYHVIILKCDFQQQQQQNHKAHKEKGKHGPLKEKNKIEQKLSWRKTRW